MAGLSVGIIGAGGVGVATASALVMRGLAGRVTVYGRDGGAAHGLALDFMHAAPAAPADRGAGSRPRRDRTRRHPRHHRRPPHDARREPARRAAPEHRGHGRRRDRDRGGRAAAGRARRHQPARRHDRVPHSPLERPAGRGDGLRHRARDPAAHRLASLANAACTRAACTRGWSASTATRACSSSTPRSSARCRWSSSRRQRGIDLTPRAARRDRARRAHRGLPGPRSRRVRRRRASG